MVEAKDYLLSTVAATLLCWAALCQAMVENVRARRRDLLRLQRKLTLFLSAVVATFTADNVGMTGTCALCEQCDAAFPAGTGPLLSSLVAGDTSLRARAEGAAADTVPGVQASRSDSSMCSGCWWGTAGPCQSSNVRFKR